ncbi:MAG: carboxypeptidase-like regulatory domain-containing protein [Minicystis sp.]
MKINWTLAFCAMSLTALGCAARGSAESSQGEPLGSAGEAVSNVAFTGTVTDAEGKPIAGATVTIDGRKKITDGQGKYSVSVPVSESGYGISITRFGFAPAAEHYLADHPTDNRHTLAAAFVTRIDPTQDNVVVAESGVKVTLPAQSLVNQDGTPVTTPVDIAIATYHPLDMPGDFTAVNKTGKPVMLSSLGAIAVGAARADDGTSVRLKDGATAPAFIPVPEVLGGAPPCIADGACRLAAWWFDSRDLLWRERNAQLSFDGNGTIFVISGTTTGNNTTVEQGTELGIWNADIEMDNAACTVIEYNIPEECYKDANATSETGLTLTFKLPNYNTPPTLVSSVYPLYWSTRFQLLYTLRPNAVEGISIEFPPNAPAHCAANLLIISNPAPEAGYPLITATGGETRFDSGAPWGGTGVPKSTVTGLDVTFNDLTLNPPADPCNSHVIFNSF